MSAPINSIKKFINAGLDTDSAVEYIAPEDLIFAQNVRFSGTGGQQLGYATDIESNELLSGELLPGINNIIGGNKFDDTAQIVAFRYNTGNKNQILLYDYDVNAYRVIFTDIVDSAGERLLPLNPQNIVKCVLINRTYLVWWAKNLEVGYTNLNTLESGGYGTVLWEDLSLIKPQCMPPPTGTYGSDMGQPANYLFSKLPQFNVQYVNEDFNYSAWSTWSKRIVPYQENTPTLGSDVTQNNYIIISVNAGSKRATVLNIACRFGTDNFAIIKSIDRADILALPNTSVDVNTEIYQAYNPTTNIYSFAFYNNDIAIPVPATETDLFYDYIWPANAGEKINGNILGLGDWKTLYARPNTNVSVGAVGYDPNIDIPVGVLPNKFRFSGVDQGSSGSGAGGHRRKMSASFAGVPHTGDTIKIVIADIRDANNTITYPYTVPIAQNGSLEQVTSHYSETIPGSNFYDNGDGTFTINFTGPPYFGMQSHIIGIFFAGSPVANSIPSILDNSVQQLALSYRDYRGRPLPLSTGNNYIVNTPSYAQVLGNAIQISWIINNATAPDGAYDYQWLTTKPPINSMIDVLGTPIDYRGTWDAYTNTPSLGVNSGTVGQTYQITTPSDPSQTGHYTNLGGGSSYNTGDYIPYNGQSWDIIPKNFGNLTGTGNILALSLNPLKLFNDQYSEVGVNTVLGYDFTPGDRCTLHYYIDDDGNNVYLNSPCVNLAVFGYDAARNIVKVEKSATFDESILIGKNVFFRLYSPAPKTQSVSDTQNSTIWYEIGERFTITNGLHDTLTGVIHDGGVYYKTRQYSDAINPYSANPHQTLSTDLNYSDFYASTFSSFGRPRSYYDELEQTEQQASIITSQNYVSGSKNNGLTRFYPANIYGESDGQTSSSQGAIQIMWQRGNTLVVIQELGTFYIPVNEAYQILNAQLTGVAISEKLLNNGRYDAKGIGIGTAKESFCTRYDTAFFIDPNKSLPMEMQINGIQPIGHKMSQYFKDTIQAAYALGKKLSQFYNDYYEEVILCIQASGGILTFYPFKSPEWQPDNTYAIAGTDVTATPNGAHCTASYNSSTGIVTYMPTTNYVGNDVATFSFVVNGNTITVNNCLNWTAGNGNVNSFAFSTLTGQPLSTLEASNTISVGGVNIPVPISITTGAYSVNGGSYTTSPGTVVDGDIIQVRVTTSGTTNTPVTATLTIGATVGTFTAITQYVEAFSFTDAIDQPASTLIESNTLTLGGLSIVPVAISVTSGQYKINGGSYTSSPGTINIGDTFSVRGTSSASPSGTTNVVLTILDRNDTFTITTIATTYLSVEARGTFQKNCSGTPGTTGTYVEYIVPAATYSSIISQADADNQATADVAANGQSHANSVGMCVLDSLIGTLLVDYYADYDADLCFYCHTAGTAENDIIVTAPENNGSTGVARYPNDGRDPATCYLLSSNQLTSGSVAMRFGVNMAYFISKYPAIDHFTFIMRGRSITAQAVTGIYAIRETTEGYLIMPETSPGSGKYIPSVSGAGAPTIPPYSSNIGNSANGTVGIGIGDPVLQLDYIVSTNTLTKTTY